MSREKPDKESFIEFRNVSKRFGRVVVFDGLSVTLEHKKTTVIIGESGTGKSVLLKHLVALLRPDAGEIYFHGQRIDNMDELDLGPIRRRFGFLFQLGALFDSMTVAQNVAFPIEQHGNEPPDRIAEIVREKLRLVGLDRLETRKPGELSGGQRKRVALARAIALEPEVVLYDEPTTGLDPVRSDVINELILKMKREIGVTGIVVTHDMTSAYKVADRILMLHHGKIIADGTPDWYQSTDDMRVRRFVDGKANEEDLAVLD